MAQKLGFIKLIEQDFEARKLRNPLYSKRAYANFLEISIGALSEILSGKRKLTIAIIEKIGLKIGLSLVEIQHYQRKEKIKVEINEYTDEEMKYQQIHLDEFGLISNWYVMALFHLIDKKDISHDSNSLAERLGILTSQVDDSLKILIRLNLIEKIGKRYSRTSSKFSSVLESDKIQQAARNFQKQILQKSIEALEEQPRTIRDHSGMTLLLNADEFEKAKEMIMGFRRKFGKTFGEDNLEGDVYQLQLSLFKLSN